MIRFLILTLLLSMQTVAEEVPESKETLNNWGALYVSFHNSSMTFKELSKRLGILEDIDLQRYAPEELNLKLPTATYDPKLAKISYSNGSTFQIVSLAERKFLVDGRAYVLPEEMGKVFSDVEIKSKLSGCTEWLRSAPLQHVGFSVFTFPAEFLVSKHGKWTATPTCEQQVQSYKELLKKSKVSISKFTCSKGAKRVSLEARVSGLSGRVEFNPWMYTYSVKTEKNSVIFLPTGKMRMGAKVCARDFFHYQELHKFVESLDPVMKAVLAGNFCTQCAGGSYFESLSGLN